MSSDSLLVGPVLRYVDETTATVWVETRAAGVVQVKTSGGSGLARTFAVHGHHYALVDIEGLAPGSTYDYNVEIDGELAWPPSESAFPASRINTLDGHRQLRMLFGSCRMSVPHDRQSNASHGVDAMRAYALALAGGEVAQWPDLMLFLGDQVYADEPPESMEKFIAARRDITAPPKGELKDYAEYAHLYELSWSDPGNRWLLSTVPSAMIFDDHDIRDDWNTSAQWRREMAATPWWHDRIVGGLGSYWIYQHLGNLSPADRAKDEMWKQVQAARATDESGDLGELIDAFAERADEQPDSYRWSYTRDIGRNRLIVVDSRCARVLKPDHRSIMDDAEVAWFDELLKGGFDHVIIGTSLPFLLSHGLHHLEAWNEAVATGAWGKRAAVAGEKLRRAIDLEHWAAFHEGFRKIAQMVLELASGERGQAPGTVTFLSGDVHHSYVSEAVGKRQSRIVQAVCSPIRNPLPRSVRMAMTVLAGGFATPLTSALARLAKVPRIPFEWTKVRGPWFDNNIATLETQGRGLSMRWEAGEVQGGREDAPVLKTVARVEING
ncbi:MAG: alkaline phosphatase D family protein [Nocardioidaceae bacterium]